MAEANINEKIIDISEIFLGQVKTNFHAVPNNRYSVYHFSFLTGPPNIPQPPEAATDTMGAFLDKPKTEKYNESQAGAGLRYGLSSMQGWRIEMEDAHSALIGIPEIGDKVRNVSVCR